MKSKFNTGFTLAEVLITLGIIGIIAAITIPTLIQKIQSVRDTAILKEDFSILNQALRRAADDDAYYAFSAGNNMTLMIGWVKTYLLPYMSAAKVCYDEIGCWSANKMKLNGERIRSDNTDKGCGTKAISLILNNSSVVCMDDFYKSSISTTYGVDIDDSSGMVFYIDTNGNNPPNTYGKDIFVVVFDSNKMAMIPAGQNKTQEEVEENCKTGGNGLWCMQLAVRNGFKLPVVK